MIEGALRFGLYSTYGVTRYDAKRGSGIGVLDPGAVPGGSTTFNLVKQVKGGGAETGSTDVVMASGGVRYCIRRYRAIL